MIRISLMALFVLTSINTTQAFGEDPRAQFAERSVTYTGGDYKEQVFKYRVLAPEKVEAGERYPVVLFLHGAGERGADNSSQLLHMCDWMAAPAQRAKYPCYMVAVQCPKEKMWIDAHWSLKEHRMSTEPTHEARMALAALDAVLKENADHVDTDRVVLTGLSMGGFGAWDLACRYPKRWSAVIPVCGGGDVEAASKLVGVPLWAWHGDRDGPVNVARSRSMIAAIKKAGGNPRYTELPGVGHNAWDAAYEGDGHIWDWALTQRLSARRKTK